VKADWGVERRNETSFCFLQGLGVYCVGSEDEVWLCHRRGARLAAGRWVNWV
jgi:hypothetical protein